MGKKKCRVYKKMPMAQQGGTPSSGKPTQTQETL
jgi:hypothetical protein